MTNLESDMTFPTYGGEVKPATASCPSAAPMRTIVETFWSSGTFAVRARASATRSLPSAILSAM